MSITLHCSCGKTLAVADQYRGKKAKCPGCGNVLAVEEPVPEAEVDLAAAVQLETPVKRPASTQDDDAELPEIRKPLRRPSDVRRSWIPWLVASVLVLAVVSLLVLCAGVGVALII